MNFYVFANWIQGVGLSGGDRIFIELSRRFRQWFHVVLFISSDGWEICRANGLTDVTHHIWTSGRVTRFGYLLNYTYRTLVCAVKAMGLRLENGYLYSSSDFLPDSLSGFILKMKNKGLVWIAAFYLFAAPPWRKDSPYRRGRWLIGFFYWLTQKPSYWLIRKYADIVFVTSEPDVVRFVTDKRGRDKVIVIKGGVDVYEALQYLNSPQRVSVENREFDCVFVGRLHYQKGILELIDIWKSVCDKKPGARLALIGNGPLEKSAKEKTKVLGLENNIRFFGFLDGMDKYNIFKNSKVVVHPATYDSGGMAAAEAMAWGLPGVSFDLEPLRTYYPCGMLKVPTGDLSSFAASVLRLLDDRIFYDKLSGEARDLVMREWSWDERARKITEQIAHN